MILNTLPKKSVLAVFIAYGGVVWLNQWHQYGYSSAAITFPPVSSWMRDSAIALIPVMLAVWIGTAFAQWLVDRFHQRMSPSTQSFLLAAILSGATSLAFMVIENSKLIWTGIGNELVFLSTICRTIYPNGNLLLSILQRAFPVYQALRFHILIQDGINLALVNLTITILLILILEGLVKAFSSRNLKSG